MADREWKLIVSPEARRRANALPEKVHPAIGELMLAIARNPRRIGKPLRNHYEGTLAARRGVYRVVYEVDDAERMVRIVTVGHRADVYRPR
jgi:mRNA-degrading endonuclease RelE of RelBE toxin-antitoxin system